MTSTPPDFSHWETHTEHNIQIRLGVDKYGRRWENVGGTWHHAPRGVMSDQAWAEHLAGFDKARQESQTPMTSSTSTPAAAPAGEATGVRSLVARLEQIAGLHTQIGGNEGFLGSLQRMEVGEGDQQKVTEAQEASKLAAQAWKTAAEAVRRNNLAVQEAYTNSPDAGNKQANTNE